MILSPKSIPGVKFIFFSYSTAARNRASSEQLEISPGSYTRKQYHQSTGETPNFHKQRRERDHPLLAPKLARK